MEKLNGRPLDWYDLDEKTKLKVLSQLADIFIRLKDCLLDKIGCLISPEDLSIGPLVMDNTADARDGELDLLGPFTSSIEYHIALINRQLELTERGEVYTNAAVDAYLVHLSLLEYLSLYPQLTSGDKSQFYLKHMDDKGDHILVDENGNITGIIDWEWAQTTCEAEAFCAPVFLLDVGAYYDGHNELSKDESIFADILDSKGRQDLASLIRSGRVQHRLAYCIAGDVEDTESFPNLFAGLLMALEGGSPNDPGKTWREWKVAALEKYKNYEGLQAVLAKCPLV